MSDRFRDDIVGLDDPAEDIFIITPGNDPLPSVTRAIRVETGGTMTVVTKKGSTVQIRFKDGETRPIRVSKVTASTCVNIEGMV